MRGAVVLLLLVAVAAAGDERRIELLVALLQANDEELRARASRELVEIGAPAAPAVARLLDDPWPDFREAACSCLGGMEAAARAFAPRLAGLARKDAFKDVRASALWAVADADPTTALPVLIEALEDPLDEIRYIAQLAMEKLPAEMLEGLLDHRKAAVRDAAIEARKMDPSDVVRLTKLLAQGDKDDRVSAAEGLAGWREQARPALDAILSACSSEDGEVAEAAIHALGRVDPANARAKDVALRALARREAGVREEGLGLLGAMGETARPQVPAVVRALADRAPNVRLRAAMTLGEWKAAEAARDLERAIDDADDGVRLAAAEALWAVTGNAQPSLGTLRGALRSKDENAPQQAVSVIARMGVAAKAALDDLVVLAEGAEKGSWEQRACAQAIANVGDPETAWRILVGAHHEEDDCRCGEPSVRLPAAFLAGKLSKGASGAELAVDMLLDLESEAVPAVVSLLGHERSEVRGQAVRILASRTQDTPAVVPALLRALGDADAEVRVHAARALEDVTPPDAVLKGLGEALDREQNATVRVEIASALAMAGAERDRVLPALLSALADPDLSQDAGSAIEALLEKDPGALAALEPRLSDPRIRVPLAEALARAAPASAVPVLRQAIARGERVMPSDWHDLGEEALPLLREALRSASAEVREAAVEDLEFYAKFPQAASSVTEVEGAARELARLLGDPSPEVRARLIETLGELGPLAAPAVPEAIRLLDGPLRRDAAELLRKIGRPAKAAAPRLAELLEKDKDPEVRLAAAGALGGMGREAGEHSNALRKAAEKDPDEAVRYCAARETLRSSIERGAYAIGVGGDR